MTKRLADSVRIEGGAVACRYCNRVLTFNFMARPAGDCDCDAAVAERAALGQAEAARSDSDAIRFNAYDRSSNVWPVGTLPAPCTILPDTAGGRGTA